MTTPVATSHYPNHGGYPPMPATGGGPTPMDSNPDMYDYEAQNPSGPAPFQKEQLARELARTPSPTPSEKKALSREGAVDWRAMANWRYWVRREWLWYYVIGVILSVIFALMTIYHKQIVEWLKPAGEWMRELKVGFLIPIAVLFILSFPPLFGHEIVAVLCGLVWGLGWGFAIVAAGTFLGEVGNFYAFKYCCRARGEKLEKQEISYACLAKIVREGGIKIALIARLSAIPGHFTTAVFSTCGMGIIVFSIAAILSLPKQFITVYLGVVLEQAEEGHVDTKTHIINYSVIAVTFAITIAAMWYINREMNRVKPAVVYERRKRRQAKNIAAANAHTNYLNPNHPSHLHRPQPHPYGAGPSDSSSSLTAFVAPENGSSAIAMQQYQPTPMRAPEPSFDAYADYGGRPLRPRRSTDASAESTDALVPTPEPPTGAMRPVQFSPPPGPPPSAPRIVTDVTGPESRQNSVQALQSAESLNQTPTQAQFAGFPPAGTTPADLASPPLPTPVYAPAPPHQGAFHIGGAGAATAAPSNNPYHRQGSAPASPAAYVSTPTSAPLGNPYGASPVTPGHGAFAAQQQQQQPHQPQNQPQRGYTVHSPAPSAAPPSAPAPQRVNTVHGYTIPSPVPSAAPSPAPGQQRSFSGYASPVALSPVPQQPPQQPPPYFPPPSGPPPEQQHEQPAHGRVDTDGSYYTASGGAHSREVTDVSHSSYGIAR